METNQGVADNKKKYEQLKSEIQSMIQEEVVVVFGDEKCRGFLCLRPDGTWNVRHDCKLGIMQSQDLIEILQSFYHIANDEDLFELVTINQRDQARLEDVLLARLLVYMELVRKRLKRAQNSSKIRPGIYEHYKGNRYRVIGIGLDTEAEVEKVAYTALYETEWEMYFRPLYMFLENIIVDGKEIPRFRFIAEE